MFHLTSRSVHVSRIVGQGRKLLHTSRPRWSNIYKIQTQEEFTEKVTKSPTPVIVDFFATWCGPCKMLTPRIESIIQENEGKISLLKVDVDEHSDLALDYEVSSVPVLVAFNKGKEANRIIGLQDTDKLRKWVGDVVNKSS
ncbi:thioredoxin-like [Lutzomyia longipalpis]|uniref:thioredoxin-like n=1 Tax=Lutzomyia longipalpis TaxID=7200 RepID=UPI0024839681|nr:thioredoxin-like [Lutzomyia longipalpis]